MPPTAMVSTAGFSLAFLALLKKKSPTFTAAVIGDGPAGPALAVAAKVTGEPVAPASVTAVAFCVPTVLPSIQVVVAMPHSRVTILPW